MALQTAVDVPLNITSENSRSERRITPAWTIAQLKGRLEPITGIPALSQRLTLKLGGSQAPIDVSAADEESTQLARFPLQAYAELNVRIGDLRVAWLSFSSFASACFILVLDLARLFVLPVLWTNLGGISILVDHCLSSYQIGLVLIPDLCLNEHAPIGGFALILEANRHDVLRETSLA
jgi:hypothetical protein